jgi:glycolate oxidase FAD binding subunit
LNQADRSAELQEAVRAAAGERAALRVVGGGTKAFYGRTTQGRALNLAGHAGIIDYEPTELVFTARAGTPLGEVEAALAAQGQMLPFEPPHYGATATLGGAIACGLSGPRRPYAGAVRDFVLGVKLLTGRGDIMRFGGQVMKNVAGYDISRAMAGAMGTLGVLLEVSLKVLPLPAEEITLGRDAHTGEALRLMNEWAARPLPLSAAIHHGDRLYVRLSGAATAVRAARERLGGELLEDAAAFWRGVREHEHDFLAGEAPLWRVSVPPAAAPLELSGESLIDWGGAQRWLRTDEPAQRIRTAATRAGGHATLFRGGDRTGAVFHPIGDGLLSVHRNLKAAFDPAGILNAGRLYEGL